MTTDYINQTPALGMAKPDNGEIGGSDPGPQPLVSILIAAFNAQQWIADTLKSAITQTWPRKEIIVIDDGSTDGTAAIARQFESQGVVVITQKNQGAAAARNQAFAACHGDYIQWLDADDLLAPDKISRQMEIVNQCRDSRTLISGAWGGFMYRHDRAEFVPTALWSDLSPVDWLIHKMGENLHMQTATWLVSRELILEAGLWDTAMYVDDDGEYLCRILLASHGVRFVAESKVYYRSSGRTSLSYIGRSDKKMEAQWRSMQLHVRYLLSLEDSERTRAACLKYLQNWLIVFYPHRQDLIKQAGQLAENLGGKLEPPRLIWKYSWIRALFGWDLAIRARLYFPQVLWSFKRRWDKLALLLEKKRGAAEPLAVVSSVLSLPATSSDCTDPLVSILVPAYNSEDLIADTLRSALAQTWKRKEIIVVDDGSTDRTLEVARQFESHGVRVVTQKNQGAAVARNTAFSHSHGEYIQWLDADDLLAPDKIAKQMAALDQSTSPRTLLSSAWGLFMYRYYRAKFVSTPLWCDLSPLEWLLRKMGQNLYMQTATWLVSRELTEAVGPWDARLLGDDDGEYFCRILIASEGVRFVPESKVFYRGPGLAFQSLSHIGKSDRRINAHWLSMKLHVEYLRSLENSERVQTACLRYLQSSLIYFYPEKTDIIKQAQQLAGELGGELHHPSLSWKYSWMKTIFGWHWAKIGQQFLLGIRWSIEKFWDRTLFRMANRKPLSN